MTANRSKNHGGRNRKTTLLTMLGIVILLLSAMPGTVSAQAPGTTPVVVSHKTMMMHGRKYYVHIVEKGQTVYSIAKAYKVESYDAVTHVDIHFLHPGDTVWLPFRGQFATTADEAVAPAPKPAAEAKPTPVSDKPAVESRPKPQENRRQTADSRRRNDKTLRVALMMPLHLNQIDEISTTKFDIEQRGKKNYRQFEFIEFYEGMLLALDWLSDHGISVELNVVDVSENSAAKVEEAFESHHVAESDVVVALLLRDAFDRASQLAQEAGVHIVNPMATRSDICATNPYMVKIQPSLSGQIAIMLDNMKAERPGSHLYIMHSSSKAEKPVLDEVKAQLDARGDIKYTLFHWNQVSKIAQVLKNTPGCNVLSIYDQGRDQNRVYAGNLLNRLAAFKTNSPTLYTLSDWTRDYIDIDFNQLQQLNYHTYSTSWDMTNSVHVDFLQLFRDRFGNEPTSQLATVGYNLTVYIGNGLARRGKSFWDEPTVSLPALLQPLHLGRTGEGLENDQADLYRMDGLRFIKATVK